MKRFLILSVMALALLVKGVSVQANEINQEYSAIDNSAETANEDTQINLDKELTEELTEELTQENLVGEIIKIEKITKNDCIKPVTMSINILRDDIKSVEPLICKEKEIFIKAKEIANIIGYNITWNSEKNSITIYNEEKDSEGLEIIVDGTEGFIDEGVSYIPLNKIIEYAKLDYLIDTETDVISIEPVIGIGNMVKQEDMTLYRTAKEIYDEDVENGTVIRMIKLKEFDKNINKDVDQFYFKVSDIMDGVFTGTKEVQAWKSSKDKEFKFTMSIKSENLEKEEQVVLNEYINSVKEKVAKLENPTDEEKVKLIDKEIRKLVSYNNNYKIEDLRNAYDSSNTAYGAVTTKKSVCQGYANTFTILAEELDIPVIKVRGYGKRPKVAHVWNSVYIEVNGKLDWYYVDSTWNDTLNSDKHLLTTAEFEENHRTWDKEVEQITRDIKYKELELDQLVKKSITLVDIPK